jgi:predicted DNA-binding protein
MSNLREMIRSSNTLKKDTVATTLRMPTQMSIFVEELADQLGLSKQEMLLNLIEAGIQIVEDEFSKTGEYNEKDAKVTFHILNTNRKNDPNDHDYMITNGIAAAYYLPWKLNINRIKEGDVVFLYENGVGIVAYGTGTGHTKAAARYGDPGECHYQELNNFIVLRQPLTASTIRRVLGRNVVFLRTMSCVPDGQRLLDFISDGDMF